VDGGGGGEEERLFLGFGEGKRKGQAFVCSRVVVLGRGCALLLLYRVGTSARCHFFNLFYFLFHGVIFLFIKCSCE
jgi:hypothetical protein